VLVEHISECTGKENVSNAVAVSSSATALLWSLEEAKKKKKEAFCGLSPTLLIHYLRIPSSEEV
jgi:hypothetical protein